MEEMQHWEFLGFMCHVTYEHFRGTDKHDEPMEVKLDLLLPYWLRPVGAKPVDYSDSLDLEESKDDAMYLSSGYELLTEEITTGKI